MRPTFGANLPLDVDLAHIDDAGQAEPRGGGGARDAMLSRARFGDDALRAQPLREQGLAQGVVDLVRTGMCQVFALEPDTRTPALGERRRKRERGRTAYPGFELALQLGLEIRAVQIAVDTGLEPIERRHQGLRYVAAAEDAVATLGIGL